MTQQRYSALILAGYDREKPDEFTTQHQQPHKALIPLGGRPMVSYVVDALRQCERVDQIVIVGMSEDDGLNLDVAVEYLPDQGGMLDNAMHAFAHVKQTQESGRHALLVTADAPLLRGEMIDWFLDACTPLDHDLYWAIVEQATMEQAFPVSRRTYLRLDEGRFCSGDLYVIRIDAALQYGGPLRELLESRKNVLRQVRLLGFGILLRYLFRRLRMQDVRDVASRLVNMDGTPLIVPFAEMGMDIDKPHQYQQVVDYMRAHADLYPDFRP